MFAASFGAVGMFVGPTRQYGRRSTNGQTVDEALGSTDGDGAKELA